MKKLLSIFAAAALAANVTYSHASVSNVSTAAASEVAKAPKPVLYRGQYFEHKGKALFAPCSGGQLRVADTAGQRDLATEYAQQIGTNNGNKRLYAEVRAVRDGSSLHITEVRRANGDDGPGCREDLRLVMFVASGNDPGWQVRIDEKGLRFRREGDKPAQAVSYRVQEPHKEELGYEADTPQGMLRISLKPELCRDQQTGARYAYRARVEIEGKVRFGCAYFGELNRE